ncbi:hypothetical protein B23_1131 [Geobacillus thermoleovorans B23]|nr:hypothetical protein B23_1131 [Geobacillus thermoleovorans B23]
MKALQEMSKGGKSDHEKQSILENIGRNVSSHFMAGDGIWMRNT